MEGVLYTQIDKFKPVKSTNAINNMKLEHRSSTLKDVTKHNPCIQKRKKQSLYLFEGTSYRKYLEHKV